jgi:phosphoserine phosphatase RsbU/P
MSLLNPQVPESNPASGATLVVIDPNGRRARVPVFPFPFRMGRAPDNNLILRDSRISRNHAQIAHENGHLMLEDLGSRHGIWVNGTRIDKSVRLDGSALNLAFPMATSFTSHAPAMS